MAVPKYVIAINRATPEQRQQVHEIVKANANGWWHAFADCWIVGGKTAAEWRDLVGVVFPIGPGGVLVLKIDTAGATWAYRATFKDSAKEWLRTHL
jgi:hypothetical protein